MKAVLITEVISPYRIPVFNELAQDGRFTFETIFLAETVTERKWDVHREKIRFPYQVLSGIKIALPNRFPVFLNVSLYRVLKAASPDIIFFGGYHHPSFFIAVLYAKWHHKKLVLWCESHALSVRVKTFLSATYRKFAVNCCTGVVVPGTLASEFIRALNVNGKVVYQAPNAVDNVFFSRAARKIQGEKEVQKRRFGYPKKLILFVGRLIPHKGLDVLLDAFSGLQDQQNLGLIVVGDGVSEQEYKAFCDRKHMTNVFFEGFQQQERLPFYYGIADIFVMPSRREEWGLVLNEAMACGLPVIASNVVGGAKDLIENEGNGFIFSSEDVDMLRDLLKRLLKEDELRHRMGERSRELIQNFSVQKCARGFSNALLEEAALCLK